MAGMTGAKERVATVFDAARTAELSKVLDDDAVVEELAEAITSILERHGFDMRDEYLVLEPHVRKHVWKGLQFPEVEPTADAANVRVYETDPVFGHLIMNRDD